MQEKASPGRQLSVLFIFPEILQVRLSPQMPPRENLWGLLKQDKGKGAYT